MQYMIATVCGETYTDKAPQRLHDSYPLVSP